MPRVSICLFLDNQCLHSFITWWLFSSFLYLTMVGVSFEVNCSTMSSVSISILHDFQCLHFSIITMTIVSILVFRDVIFLNSSISHWPGYLFLYYIIPPFLYCIMTSVSTPVFHDVYNAFLPYDHCVHLFIPLFYDIPYIHFYEVGCSNPSHDRPKS